MTDFFSCSKCNSKNIEFVTSDDRDSAEDSNETYVRCRDCKYEVHYDCNNEVMYYRKGKALDPNENDLGQDANPDFNN